MCLIAYQPRRDKSFSEDILRSGWSGNTDGAGYCFSDTGNKNGRLIIRKAFFKVKDLIQAYKLDHAQYGETSNFAVHFRFATHGDKTEENVHPFSAANGKIAVMHNGILTAFNPPIGSQISDTNWFCRTMLAHRQPSQIMGKAFTQYLSGLAGKSNKILIMDNSSYTVVINLKEGITQKDTGRWYSNTDYIRSVNRYHYTPGTKWTDSNWETYFIGGGTTNSFQESGGENAPLVSRYSNVLEKDYKRVWGREDKGDFSAYDDLDAQIERAKMARAERLRCNPAGGRHVITETTGLITRGISFEGDDKSASIIVPSRQTNELPPLSPAIDPDTMPESEWKDKYAGQEAAMEVGESDGKDTDDIDDEHEQFLLETMDAEQLANEKAIILSAQGEDLTERGFSEWECD